MSEADMERVCQEFQEAARRAARADFDLLELQYGHGYLLGHGGGDCDTGRSPGAQRSHLGGLSACMGDHDNREGRLLCM